MWYFRGMFFSVLVFASAVCLASGNDPLQAQFFSDMIHLSDGQSARISSFDTTGANIDFKNIKSGHTLKLADIEGAGCIRHIYFTLMAPPHYLRDLVLRMYWDNEPAPSVEVPFGDFFGLGHERNHFFRSLMVTVNEGGGGIAGTIGFNTYFPMPFRKGARMTLTNQGPHTIGAVWYHIDYEKMKKVKRDVGYFHAQWHRENPTVAVGDKPNVTIHDGKNTDGKENYVILDAKGHGNFAGYFLNVDNLAGGWYGEGDDMIFIDGEGWPPSFHGTGTEEIFGGGACPNSEYAGPYTGFYLIGNPDYQGKVSMYRWYVADPIHFQKSIRVTIEHGHANNFANDYSSTAFWYQAEPHAPFPPLPPAKDRHPHEGNDPYDKAYITFFKAQDALNRLQGLLQKTGIQLTPEFSGEVHGRLAPAANKAFEAKDYGAALDNWGKMIGMIDAFIAENSPKEPPK